ncbi:MAG: chemotaxis protein CheZ [Piscirickettsiaceae bacterium]|nr:MAG: chemotaxis protein CheZ [Piscirickettsiaceae bacterium]
MDIIMDDDQAKNLLTAAQALVAALTSNNQSAVDDALNLIIVDRERTLFNEVGRLTRQLHESIASFALDGELNKLTDKEIPDAKERLNHVINITDEAANTTLNALDEILPVTTDMQRQSEELSQRWQTFLLGDVSSIELKIISADITSFLEWSKKNSLLIHQKSNEIMMAQEFQDLTGQIITKVIAIVQDVETNLVNLVCLAGTQNMAQASDDDKHKLEGPAVPGVIVESAVNNQHDVDDLLSSLGF